MRHIADLFCHVKWIILIYLQHETKNHSDPVLKLCKCIKIIVLNTLQMDQIIFLYLFGLLTRNLDVDQSDLNKPSSTWLSCDLLPQHIKVDQNISIVTPPHSRHLEILLRFDIFFVNEAFSLFLILVMWFLSGQNKFEKNRKFLKKLIFGTN